jgi:hypothetical protein
MGFVCDFRMRGFPLGKQGWAVPCGVSYHVDCIRVGAPFTTRLQNDKGLVCPGGVTLPHFVCEPCQVREVLQRELAAVETDTELLLMERVRLIDSLSWWQTSTMKQYGGHLKFLERFGQRYGALALRPTPLAKPPNSPGYALMWAQLLYSLRSTNDGERIKFNTIRGIRSAAALYYTWDLHVSFPGRVRRERKRDELKDYVLPSEESMLTFASKGMARRLGTQVKQSWALSHVHIAYINRKLQEAYEHTTSHTYRHELACAATANLLAYLGWLRGTELFDSAADELTVILPADAAQHELPPHVGAVLLNLLPETKSNPCQVADIVAAYETLSGLNLGFWAQELQTFPPFAGDGYLFSTKHNPKWVSRYFRETYAWPLLEQMRTVDKEPSLQMFGDKKGTRIRDKLYSMHSWRRAGRSRVSRSARHNEPKAKAARRATDTEVYEHGRWANRRDGSGEDMAATYNQWGLVERLAITLLCM